ncbi:hypothetical protein BGAL_0333g00040 [Botrytis galanthina]|uniref:Uncharacterized protein n=1 Tax=Botrytis galanthina TaxID=278940 RepID=A0A4S8QTE9_9HELO|nr:hypothetical protein BGAL_0333g00040 [Botrytis galanthina]
MTGPQVPSRTSIEYKDIGQALHACLFFLRPMFSTPDIFEMSDLVAGGKAPRSRYACYGTSSMPGVRAEQSRVELSGESPSHTDRLTLMK